MMSQDLPQIARWSKAEKIRALFTAYLSKDRDIAEALLADEFTFTSPYDDAIDRAGYFERCWPNSGQIESHTVEKICVQGNECFALYRASTRDGKEFRNTEFFTFDGDRIKSVSVYFGATYRGGIFAPD